MAIDTKTDNIERARKEREKQIANIAGHAAEATYGVVGMAAASIRDGLSKVLPKNRLQRGIVIKQTQLGLLIELYIITEEGINLYAACANLASAVYYTITKETNEQIDDIIVHVVSVHTPELGEPSAQGSK